jgi:hypothetical protein
MKHYVFVVDGEVAGSFAMPELPEEPEQTLKYRAILESNPTVVPHDGYVTEGSIWDGTNFTPPA